MSKIVYDEKGSAPISSPAPKPAPQPKPSN